MDTEEKCSFFIRFCIAIRIIIRWNHLALRSFTWELLAASALQPRFLAYSCLDFLVSKISKFCFLLLKYYRENIANSE